MAVKITRRRLVGLTAGAAGGSGLLAGCSDDSASTGGKAAIRFSYLWTGEEAKAMEKVIKKFNASQSDITVQGTSNPDKQAQLAAMTGSKGTFDISDNFGSVTGDWASKGVIKSLQEYAERDDFDLDAFVPAALDSCRHEGELYQLPIAVNNYGLLYSKDLFASAGISEPPTTTGAWAEAIGSLTKKTSKGLSQLGLGGASGAATNYRLLGLTNGGRWYRNGRPTPADPGNVAGAQFYVDNVIKKYGVEAVNRFTSGFGDYQSPQNPFYQGKLAMVIDGEWQPAFIKEFAPELDWGVVPVPHPDDRPELADTTLVETGSLFIPSNSKHPDQAWEFMKYLVSEEAMLTFTKALSNLPSRTALLTDEAYSEIPHFDVFLKLLSGKNASAIPSQPSLAQYTSDLATADDQITRMAKTPAAAYNQVATAAKAYG